MITIVVFLLFISFYFFYNTSKRAVKHDGFKVEKWISNNGLITKVIACVCALLSLIFNILIFGFGSGILLFFVLLMTQASLIIVLTPLKLINYKSLIVLAVICLFFEFFTN
jgi:hypothetical protein